MDLFKKKIKIPTGDTKQVDALRSWTVSWNSISDRWGTNETRFECFLDKSAAEDFINRLSEAHKLLKNGYNVNINVKENK